MEGKACSVLGQSDGGSLIQGDGIERGEHGQPKEDDAGDEMAKA